MKVKFPILLHQKCQYNALMKYLGEHGVKWCSGHLASDLAPPERFPGLPMYILYGSNEPYNSDKLFFICMSSKEEMDDYLESIKYFPREVEI